jgi:hypothetical protein
MPLPKWELSSGGVATCPSCASRNMPHVYPAAFAQVQPSRGETALDGEAACFDHPGNRAVASCQQCGRFVCQLCAVQLATGVVCPSCLAAGLRKSSPVSADARSLYDTWALSIPILLIIIWPLTILSAPAVVALAIMKWKAPISLVRRNRWRFVVGLAVGILQGIGWAWLIVYLVAKIRSGS